MNKKISPEAVFIAYSSSRIVNLSFE